MITRLGICGLEIYLGILGMGDSLAELKTFMLDILIITLHTHFHLRNIFWGKEMF